MPTNANIGILIPGNFGGKPPTTAEFNQFFRSAESQGFHSLWVTDRVFHAINSFDPMVLLTWAAAVTQRIRLGTAVYLWVLRHPVLSAKTIAMLDYVSDGRLTMGISLGGRDWEFEPLNVPVRTRVSRFEEGLTLARKLWSEQDVTFHGRHYNMEKVNIDPKPVQKASIPILMGGGADAALKRAAEMSDGWIAGGAGGAEAFQGTWQKVQDFAKAAGKNAESLESVKLLYINVGQNREQCIAELEAYTHAYYGPQYDVENNCVFGPPADCAAKIQGFIDAGAKTIILGPTWPDEARIAPIAQDIMPLLK